jgi:hypothetical protein
MKEMLPTKATLDQKLPEGGHRYRLLFIVPKRDFGPQGFLIDGKWVKTGWVVTDGLCNVMPGATWFQTVQEAKHAIDILIGVRGDAEMFWEILRPFRHTPGQRNKDFTGLESGRNESCGRHYAKYDRDVCVEVGTLPEKEPKQFIIAAYKPKDEEHPVLLVTVDGVTVGMVHRRGERMYDLLKQMCYGRPEWMFGQEARPL